MTTGRRASTPRSKPGQRAGAVPPSAPRVHELAAQLAHDVGKYLARTARNLPATGALDADLIDMLCRDLYGDPGGPRPAARFATLADALLPLLPDQRLPEVGGKFGELADLENRVRSGQPAAVTRAVALALQIEQLLRALATQCQTSPEPRTR